MILVIINGSLAFAIPTIILIINLNITTMFEIKREIVNSIGNVQRSECIGFVDCTKDELINVLANNYHKLACADTLYYKLRGQSLTVRYRFIYRNLMSIADAISASNTEIAYRVAEANDYIREANAAYKESNRRRGIKDNSLAIKPVVFKEFDWGKWKNVVDNCNIDNDVIVVNGD